MSAILSCNFPYCVAKNEEFEELLTSGDGRDHLKIPCRKTDSNDIEKRRLVVERKRSASLQASMSKISITFELWTDKTSRGFLAVTGHYFDSNMVLRAPLLDIKHISTAEEGHTADRLILQLQRVCSQFSAMTGKRKLAFRLLMVQQL